MLTQMLSKKSLDAARNDAARAYIRKVIADGFDGNVSRFAEAIDLSQTTLSDFLNGKRGAGLSLLDAVATYRAVSIDVVIGRAPEPTESYPNKHYIRESIEYRDAPESVRHAFDALETDTERDQSVVAWALVFSRLVQAHALLGDEGLRSIGGRRLHAGDAVEQLPNNVIPLLPPKSDR